jgi:hypothetical protein
MKRLMVVLVVLVCFALVLSTAVQAKKAAKVPVCHVPPGNMCSAHVIMVSPNAVEAHENHGDVAGRDAHEFCLKIQKKCEKDIIIPGPIPLPPK